MKKVSTQIKAVKIISDLRNKINTSDSLENIIELIQKAILIGVNVPAYPGSIFKRKSRIEAVATLDRELEWFKKAKFLDLELAKFQIVYSLGTLAMSYVECGISEVNDIAYSKV
ncbi:hypothetical protein QWZ08_16265 [Ferruginibacter paludis]|uniref:hypothetical protein n=1 Tax=Ferruginibacter paludis TaxID=1310417 RepID=UPI0025B4387B|nr:hypothetical protein [Ferruginibacter paludis]MDN3657205.1 hypothetical protein [Ferruginibacter paludis]